MSKHDRRPSPAIVLAALALVFALAGTAVAADMITGKQVRNGSLTGKDVKNKSLTARDFRGSVRGPTGARGPAGATGATDPLSLQYVQGANTSAQSGVITGAVATCPAGKSVTGGGVYDLSQSDVRINSSFPRDNESDADSIPDDEWVAYVFSSTTQTFRVLAICTTPNSVSQTGVAVASK